ncbi:signal peptidase I [Streptomyces alkaliphilus]|uniref:signal peptidase I n=1 Tax=Streptomyces alkaliphilus TaxID=1472722 RepID=UPI00117D9D9C|nr:signal peptidase I [Streptomyces alkaliphilus]MQS07533.1 signal peptidase I [Streptomyces alkaliphilus]
MGAARRGGGRLGRWLSGITALVGCLLFLGGFVLVAVLYQPYAIPTDSMAPTVRPDDRVLAHRVAGAEVRRGDVVVFRQDSWGELPMVKRVVAIGGDTVACCDDEGRLLVNGRPIVERYLDVGEPASTTPFEYEVPPDELFLLGDRRADSLDSRTRLMEGETATVPRDRVSARVEATVWPPERFGPLPRAHGFADLPGGLSQPGPFRPLLWAIASGAVLILLSVLVGPVLRGTTRMGGGGARGR